MTRVRRFLLLAMFGWVLLDHCSPLVPGAFSFDPRLSVDGLGGARVRQATPPRLATAVPPVLRMAPLPLPLPRPAVVDAVPVAWASHLARDHVTVLPDARPSPDDH